MASIQSYMWVERAGVRATLHCTLILLSAPPSSYMSDILGREGGKQPTTSTTLRRNGATAATAHCDMEKFHSFISFSSSTTSPNLRG